MKYISAGHCNTKGRNYDPGARGVYGQWEANETIILRDAVIREIKGRGYSDIVQDLDGESLNQYLKRIRTGIGDVVVEFHFNSGPSEANGTEALIGVYAERLDEVMAAEFVLATSAALGIKRRGVKSEATTRHKRLGLMKEIGIVTLVEVCFISNANDMAAYYKNFKTLVRYYADIIIKYDSSAKEVH